jgi:hypothetical protein
LKTTIISSLLVLSCLRAAAQSNFYKLNIGAGTGITQSFADVPNNTFSKGAYGTLDYFLTPFLSLGGELQKGKVKGGGRYTDRYEREFGNSYISATLNGKLYLGAILDNQSAFVSAFRWFYLGAGAGIIKNKLTTITRVKSNGYIFPGKNNSKDLVFPLNTGINFFIRDGFDRPRIAFNINLQTNITLGEGLDGYDDSPVKFKSGNPDVYSFYTVGVKYSFGMLGLSRKSLY